MKNLNLNIAILTNLVDTLCIRLSFGYLDFLDS